MQCVPHFGAETYQTRALVDSGIIGKLSGAYCRTSHGGPEVYYAEIRDAFGEKGEELWFFKADQASVGALFDMGVYAVASLVAVMGTVESVMGRATPVLLVICNVELLAMVTELVRLPRSRLEGLRGCAFDL